MFKVSTKGDYGLLFLSALAEKLRTVGMNFVSIKEISKEKNLSLKYLSQIVLPLREAGLIESKEGKMGGYRLSRPAKEITLMEVLEILEGDMATVRCCGNKSGQCGAESQCGVKGTWKVAQNVLTQFLKSKTLEDTLLLRTHTRETRVLTKKY